MWYIKLKESKDLNKERMIKLPFQHEPKNKLGKLILDRGYTIRDIGSEIGFKQQNSFYEVISGAKCMPIRKWIALSEFLEMSVNELIKLYDSKL